MNDSLKPVHSTPMTSSTSIISIPHKDNGEITDQNIVQVVIPCLFIVFAFFIFYWIKIGVRSRLGSKCRQTGLKRNSLDLHNIRYNQVLGHGSFGTVLKGNYGDLEVAVKITCVEKYSRWFNEKSVLLENNDNENVVRLIDYGVKMLSDGEKCFCLVLEYADLDCLRSFLQRNSVGLERCLHYAMTLTSAVAYIHSNRNGLGRKKSPVIHQDIKSANVLLSSAKGCILGDFGLASKLEDFGSCEKVQVGTPRYMSPEKLDGHPLEGRYLLKSDIYALGLVLYEIITRCYFVNALGHLYLPEDYKSPYSDCIGCNPTVDEMRNIVLHQNIRPNIPQTWRDNNVLKTLQYIIQECWRKDLYQRPQAIEVEKYIASLESKFHIPDTCVNISINKR